MSLSSRIHSRRAAAKGKGQTLLLFAMTLMLLALMVLMILSIGTKVREKIELQTVADAAAFSNAVAEARTFNVVSLMNRTQITHMVAQAGVQSMLSFTSFFISNVAAAYFEVNAILAELAGMCASWPPNICACINYPFVLAFDAWPLWFEYLYQQWTYFFDEYPATFQARFRWYAAMLLYAEEMLIYPLELEQNTIDDQKMARRVMNNAAAGSPWAGEWSAPGAASDVAYSEIEQSIGCLSGGGAACNPPVLQEHAVEAALGSRGFPFVTGRWNGIMKTTESLQDLMTITNPVSIEMGSGYYAPLWTEWHSMPPSLATWSYGDDHGALEVTGPCGTAMAFPFIPGFNHVRGGNMVLTSEHVMWGLPDGMYAYFGAPYIPAPVYIPAIGLPMPPPPPPAGLAPPIPLRDLDPMAHNVSPLPWFGIWPLMIDYNFNEVAEEDNNFGQPKNYALIERNYAARGAFADPWALNFNFTFKNTGGGEKFDNRGLVLASDGSDISRQAAFATGIAYYHRGEDLLGHHWKEPPNFLNPFWRATLVTADTDQTGRTTDQVKLWNDTGNTNALRTYNAFGTMFKGIQ